MTLGVGGVFVAPADGDRVEWCEFSYEHCSPVATQRTA